ncbi:LCP family protein [Fructilactobacillus sanfranciscensis]|uniref:LCP family glycopolymer transferase n=1 Tax=Fructilactobacillus sanfranciscensis TaxID=1625 RepID=UPI001CDC291E|nr:LCP family protein [Fructilactobacillus sanfranciscensis]
MAENENNNFTPKRRSETNHFINDPKKFSYSKKNNHLKSNNYQPKNFSTQSNEIEYHPINWTILVILLIIMIIGLIFGYQQYNKARDTFGDTYMASRSSRNVSKILKERKPFSILLMGTDTGALGRKDKGRTDSLIVATVNPKTNTTKLVSIPRDTKVVVPGDRMPYEKINAAYTIGGPDSATEVASKLLNVPIDFYGVINMGGIKKMVNAVGGVDITPNLTFNYEGISVKKGKKEHMTGQTALQYTRMRYQDPLGDYGRQIRQREVLEQILKNGLKISSVTKYSDILKSLDGNILTNLSFEDMMTAGSAYRGATKNLQEDTLQCDNATVDGVSYQVAPNGELLKISNELRESLGLKKSPTLTKDQKHINSNSGSSSDDSIFTDNTSVNNNDELVSN